MKRTLVSLLSLLTLSSLFTLTSCQKETTGNGTSFHATMEGTTDGKTVLNGTALNWVSGDQVAIYGTAGRGIYSATPQTPATVATLDNVSGETGDGPFRAFYPASLTTDGMNITLPATQTYAENSIHEFPMYAESATNQLSFRNLCGVLKLHLTKANTSISSIIVTANAPINGNFTISNLNDESVLFYAEGGSNTVVLNCATAQAIGGGKDFYITLPATFDSLKSIELNTDDGRYCIKTVKTNVCINVQRNTVTEIEFGENDMNFVEPLPEGALPGLFTINANGGQVRFSQGNLHYQPSTQTWQFADSQNDCIGLGADIVDASYTGLIDHFGWGTGANPTLCTYNDNDYSSFVDWGTNAITNGGNQSNLWRTLSSSEWDYIFYSRTNASTKYGSGCVNGVYGVIILPDNWIMPDACTFNSGLNGRDNNNYLLSEWIVMESNGAVFLPAGGARWPSSSSVELVGTAGSYWSSTPNPSDEHCARGFGFELSNSNITVSSQDGSHRCCLFMIRLVLDNSNN
ncbi:MAG: hypothetical protein IJ785_02420 [Bacteroidales bacterium]|nr:hypothetical protein [Bacteroidales bacterium]